MNITCEYSELKDPSTLKKHPKNPNRHSPDQIDRLCKLIKYHGFRHPIVVSSNSGYIVAGHGRLDAAVKLGMKEVPVDYQDFKTEESEYAFLVSDNAIAIWAELDLSSINSMVPDLGPDFDIDYLGIKDFLIEPADKITPGCDEDDVPEVTESFVKPGDVWQLGNHRLMCGDSALIDNVEKLMNGEKAILCFTDPPYGVSYAKKNKLLNSILHSNSITKNIENDDLSPENLSIILKDVFTNIYLSLDDKGSYYICSPQGGEQWMMMTTMKESSIPCRHVIIWVKNAPVFSLGRLDYDYRHEPILYGWKKSHDFIGGGEFKNSVWEISRETNKLHPTMKPVSIMENAINNSSRSGDLVIDFFGGSGSTLIACEKTNRKCRMIEIDPHYCGVIIERWQKFSGKKAERLNAKP